MIPRCALDEGQLPALTEPLLRRSGNLPSVSSDSTRRRWDALALVVAAVPLVMGVLYVRIIQSQGNDPLPWVLVVLGLAAALAFYASTPFASGSPVAIALAAALLIVMGILGIFSIGLPLLVAGAAATAVAARRSG